MMMNVQSATAQVGNNTMKMVMNTAESASAESGKGRL